MEPLSSLELACVCRIFMDLAYPGGPDTIPVGKRPYYDINTDGPISDMLPPMPIAVGVCRDLSQKTGGQSYEFRLGSVNYPHLKLRVQIVAFHDRPVRVYSVDTHDGFFQAQYHSTEEAEIWRLMVEQNRVLKHQIEEALGCAGYLTSKQLLQLDLLPAKPV